MIWESASWEYGVQNWLSLGSFSENVNNINAILISQKRCLIDVDAICFKINRPKNNIFILILLKELHTSGSTALFYLRLILGI